MKQLIAILLTTTAVLVTLNSSAQLTIQFPSKDGLTLTAQWYPVNESMPVILLCHQNRFSRGEYTETALKLNKFGFNCLAIDQRVGDEINGVKNQTARLAKKQGMNPTFLDAEQDIQASIDYLYEKYGKPVIVMGSSYSASLALKLSNHNPKVLGVVAFSPGEYFSDKTYIRKSMSGFDKPLLAISSKAESSSVKSLISDAGSVLKIQYVPKNAGEHGSKVLWSSFKGNEEYWIVLMNFLDKLRFLD
ncbi:MAG: alpha/beta hydrolase [Bacteroidota bacterium]